MSYNNRIYRYYCESIKGFEIILSESPPQLVCPNHDNSTVEDVSTIDSYKYNNYLLSVNKNIDITNVLQKFYTTMIKGTNSNNILREIKLLYKLEGITSFNLQFNNPKNSNATIVDLNILNSTTDINIYSYKFNTIIQSLEDSYIELHINYTINDQQMPRMFNIYQIELIYEKL
jgi:hypothetical protein